MIGKNVGDVDIIRKVFVFFVVQLFAKGAVSFDHALRKPVAVIGVSVLIGFAVGPAERHDDRIGVYLVNAVDKIGHKSRDRFGRIPLNARKQIIHAQGRGM